MVRVVLASLGLENFGIVLQVQRRDLLQEVRGDVHLLMRLQV